MPVKDEREESEAQMGSSNRPDPGTEMNIEETNEDLDMNVNSPSNEEIQHAV